MIDTKSILSSLETRVHEFDFSNYKNKDWELQFDPKLLWVTLRITHPDPDPGEPLEPIYNKRFVFLAFLEEILESCFSESTNHDACSFDYKYDTDHLGDTYTFTVTITDYLN